MAGWRDATDEDLSRLAGATIHALTSLEPIRNGAEAAQAPPAAERREGFRERPAVRALGEYLARLPGADSLGPAARPSAQIAWLAGEPTFHEADSGLTRALLRRRDHLAAAFPETRFVTLVPDTLLADHLPWDRHALPAGRVAYRIEAEADAVGARLSPRSTRAVVDDMARHLNDASGASHTLETILLQKAGDHVLSLVATEPALTTMDWEMRGLTGIQDPTVGFAVPRSRGEQALWQYEHELMHSGEASLIGPARHDEAAAAAPWAVAPTEAVADIAQHAGLRRCLADPDGSLRLDAFLRTSGLVRNGDSGHYSADGLVDLHREIGRLPPGALDAMGARERLHFARRIAAGSGRFMPRGLREEIDARLDGFGDAPFTALRTRMAAIAADDGVSGHVRRVCRRWVLGADAFVRPHAALRPEDTPDHQYQALLRRRGVTPLARRQIMVRHASNMAQGLQALDRMADWADRHGARLDGAEATRERLGESARQALRAFDRESSLGVVPLAAQAGGDPAMRSALRALDVASDAVRGLRLDAALSGFAARHAAAAAALPAGGAGARTAVDQALAAAGFVLVQRGGEILWRPGAHEPGDLRRAAAERQGIAREER